MAEETRAIGKLIHIAQVSFEKKGKHWLYLRQLEPLKYVWFVVEEDKEQESGIWGATSEEAIFEGITHWRKFQFTSLNCGFRYTLPERDEIGTPALFHQMAASYATMNGIYFESELGCNCIVQNAPLLSRQLWDALRQKGRL